jgi:hypothetical protein
MLSFFFIILLDLYIYIYGNEISTEVQSCGG